MRSLIAITCFAAAAISGCATQSNSGSVYSANQAQREQTIRTGVVESVRNVTIDKGQTGVGTLTGGALGGLAAGSNIGSGNGAIAAGILGAVAGGIAGQRIENNVSNRPGLEITVKLDNGDMRAIVQDADEPFRAGDRVRMVSSGRTVRVTH